MKPFTFPRSRRLLRPADYRQVFDDAQFKAAHPCVLILSRRNDGNGPRLGLVISKKSVRRAHERNRIKRIARERFRLSQHQLPSIDAIVLARKGADTKTTAELNVIFTGLWKRISKRALNEPAAPVPGERA